VSTELVIVIIWWAVGSLGAWFMYQSITENMVIQTVLSLFWFVSLPIFGLIIGANMLSDGGDEL